MAAFRTEKRNEEKRDPRRRICYIHHLQCRGPVTRIHFSGRTTNFSKFVYIIVYYLGYAHKCLIDYNLRSLRYCIVYSSKNKNKFDISEGGLKHL